MKTYRQSQKKFIIEMVLYLILACPTLGLMLIPMIVRILSYQNNTLVLDETGVTINTGTFNKNSHNIRYSKINSVTVNQTFLDSSNNCGTLTIFSGNDVSGIQFKDIDSPQKVKKELDMMIEKNNQK